jgi:Spy/CpxP family protein refolding chaperone
MRPIFSVLIGLALFAIACGRAPLPGDTSVPAVAPREMPAGDIEHRVFPPEMIMQHQGELALEPAQKEAILKEADRAQSEMLKLEWEMSAEKEKLAQLLDKDGTDEAEALAAADKVIALENRIKLSHLTMLVRIKNGLNAQQQKRLRELRHVGEFPNR